MIRFRSRGVDFTIIIFMGIYSGIFAFLIESERLGKGPTVKLKCKVRKGGELSCYCYTS